MPLKSNNTIVLAANRVIYAIAALLFLLCTFYSFSTAITTHYAFSRLQLLDASRLLCHNRPPTPDSLYSEAATIK